VLDLIIEGLVDPALTAGTDISIGLAKLRAKSSTGATLSARAAISMSLAVPAQQLSVGVGGLLHTAGHPTLGPSQAGPVTVGGGDTALLRVDVTNSGPIASAGGQYWLVLPAGLSCADIANVSDDGTCSDEVAVTLPTPSTASVVAWTVSQTLAPGATRAAPLTVDLTLPQDAAIEAHWTPWAFVRSVSSASNLNAGAQTYPLSNVDPSVPVAQQTIPAAADSIRLTTANPRLSWTRQRSGPGEHR